MVVVYSLLIPTIASFVIGSSFVLLLSPFAIMVSPSYLANIESGARPAPSLLVLNNISYALGLNYEERVCLYDLAAATKKDGTVPADIAEYIYSDNDVKVFLRKSIKLGFIGSDLLELI